MKKVSIKKSYEQHFSKHERYMEERSSSSTSLGAKYDDNYVNIPEPKTGSARE